MQDIAELERRISAAMERIATGLDGLGSSVAPTVGQEDLSRALEEERIANAQLAERLRAVRERDGARIAELQAQVDRLTRKLDAQGLEAQRMRKTTIQLREHLRGLIEDQAGQVTDAAQINAAMQMELEALRATRSSEMAEMEEILAALQPLVAPVGTETGVQHDA